MNEQIEKARELFLELEAKRRNYGDVALRNFEIQSRLARMSL